MDDKINSKRVLITGCSSGFGLLTAVNAAKAGFDCIATMRNLDKAKNLTDALERANTTATIDKLDVTEPQDIIKITEKHAPVDILINNAGILVMGSFLDLTEDEMRNIFETNYFGAVALTRAVMPDMIKAQKGMIINIASLAGLTGHMYNSAYAATKHALIGFSRSIRLELEPFNIKVVSVEPGYHKTEIIRTNANLSDNFYNKQSPMCDYNRGFLRLMFDKILPRAGDAHDVANKIVRIMQTENPKPHYVIGKDAKFATRAIKLGFGSLIEKKAIQMLITTTRREIRREESRKAARKKTSKNS
jgi:short-subunit dehydrogenase